MKGLVVSLLAVVLALVGVFSLTVAEKASAHAPSGAIFTTVENGSIVNANVQYTDKREVYLDGGPPPNAPSTSAGLDPGNYYFQVTDPSGKVLLSTDPVVCREIHVNEAGVIDNYVSAGRTNNPGSKACNKDGKQFGKHDTGVDIDHAGHGAITVQLMPFDNTPNPGGVYKVWVTFVEDFQGDPTKVDNNCGNGCFHGFVPAHSKTDNYKVKGKLVPPVVTFLKFYDANANGTKDSGEQNLAGWQFTVTDPLGVSSVVYTGADGTYTIDPADNGTYTICESAPVETGWVATTPTCRTLNVSDGQVGSASFGNAYYGPFEGGLTIGYWKTHSLLGPAGPRDETYDQLPVVLGIAANGISVPEVNVTTEAIAVDTLTTAGEGCSGDCLVQLKAQELGAKLNCLKFAGFCDSSLGLGGSTVESILAAADQLLDDVANGTISGEDAIKAVAEPLKNQLDSANNNGHTPVLFVLSPTPGPYSFP